MNRNAAAISQLVKNKLGEYSNIKDKLIMQTYDGASVMSGHINGVQAIVRQEYPFAHFVHCAAHRLNLVLCQSASSISPVKIFFINVGAFSTLTSNDPEEKHSSPPIILSSQILVILGGFIVPVSLMSFIRIMRSF